MDVTLRIHFLRSSLRHCSAFVPSGLPERTEGLSFAITSRRVVYSRRLVDLDGKNAFDGKKCVCCIEKRRGATLRMCSDSLSELTSVPSDC